MFTVKGSMTDTKLQTDFSYTVEVINDSPYFKQALKEQRVVLGDVGTYELPTPEDKENMAISVKTSLIKGDPLPAFIKY
jgi:hypothetical protein